MVCPGELLRAVASSRLVFIHGSYSRRPALGRHRSLVGRSMAPLPLPTLSRRSRPPAKLRPKETFSLLVQEIPSRARGLHRVWFRGGASVADRRNRLAGHLRSGHDDRRQNIGEKLCG
jgi:hypothetical protein